MIEADDNLFLRSLPERDRMSLEPFMRRCVLRVGAVLTEQGERLSALHFVERGIISSVVPMADGRMIEARMVGNEGFTGLEACHHPAMSSTRLFVQTPGVSRTMDSGVFRRLLFTSETLQAAVADYDWTVRAELEQSAACSAIHLTEQRLAKWLLRCHDRCEGDVLNLTQEFLAATLGTQRTTINMVARSMARSGAIRCRRGEVTVRDRAVLETLACECYRPTTAAQQDPVPGRFENGAAFGQSLAMQ